MTWILEAVSKTVRSITSPYAESATSANDATLARLFFCVSPEPVDDFAEAYEQRLVPILRAHGLVESTHRGRKTIPGVFSRLFEVEAPAMVPRKWEALREDPAWQGVLQDLEDVFQPPAPEVLVPYDFENRPPAVEGCLFEPPSTPLGPGAGHWRTYDITDGLAGMFVWSILQDREGYLWFGTMDQGVCRYDGESFTTFTTQDGLGHNDVRAMLQDREGRLWFATGWIDAPAGGSRYDGGSFARFTSEGGLPGDYVSSILEDRDG